ncbi:glutathione S-transferase family protein [Aliterella atlantica]|uniref:Glutathione S-transferase n=1 Tax=Aliterella atlantica CENA595 TaxID=1618023 RepID=A0A0D8ZRN0_9CYAN|nr:glutathione S-transferase family protein [Aliterella atlantica]KJH71380.1 glutathione S-transferase [Aliterella atlantica CENA595]
MNRLITIAISHYCEKARWALDWLKVPYVEESHAPVFHRLTTRRLGGKSVPVLVTESGVFTDSRDILHHIDAIATTERHLYPSDPQLRSQVEQLEELFDRKLGVYVRQWGYYYRIGDLEALQEMWSNGATQLEQVGVKVAFPVMRQIVKRAYDVSAASAASSLTEVRQIFELVSQRLSGDRSYLVGDKFTAADLTFAALASPVLRPKQHPIQLTQAGKPNEEMAAVIKELRKTKAGKFALRLYQEQRHNNSDQ